MTRSQPTADDPFRLPVAFQAADAVSSSGQRRTIRATATRLMLAVAATLCLSLGPLWPTELSEHHEVEVLGIVAAALFLAALLLEVWIVRTRPERIWYDGRAVAESAKTLAWRYAVGGAPYPIESETAPAELAADITGLGTDIAALRAIVSEGGATTAWMDRARDGDLESRRALYVRERVRDQEEWYTRKARYNKNRARWWSALLLGSEAVAVALALGKALSIISVDLASVAAAVIASGAAWVGVKQHESIGAAYELASKELATVHVRLLGVDSERAWALQVASAEEAISREHTMWRASRTKLDANGSDS